jgi:capsular exopolysaccharide synthesis family protein
MNQPTKHPGQSSGSQAPSATAVALDPLRLLRTYYPWLIGSGIVALVVGVAIYLVLVRVMPRFDATMLFTAGPPLSEDVTDDIGVGVYGEEGDRFIATQVFMLKSDAVLSQTLEQPRFLQTQWAQQFMQGGIIETSEALEELMSIASARSVPQTQFFSVRVRTPSPDDSAEIANAIGDVYMQQYQRQARAQVNELITGVEQQVRSLTGQIEELDLRIDALQADNDIQSLNQAQLVEYTELAQLQPRLVENRDERAQIQEQLREYKRIIAQPGPPVYPDIVRQQAQESRTALTLEAQIRQQRAQVAALSETLGDDNVQSRRAQATLRGLEAEYDAVVQEQMADSFASLIESLESQIASYDATYEEMQATRERLNARIVDKSAIIEQLEAAQTERTLVVERLQARSETAANLELIARRQGRVQVYERATPADRPAFPTPIPVVAASLVIIVGAVSTVIVLKELREQRVRSPRDIALIPATRVLGILPELKMDPSEPETVELAARERPLGAVAEASRQLRNSIFKACDARGHRTIVFTGGLPGSGCTAVVTNLAESAANVQRRVLVIDANLRRPSLHEVYGVARGDGLAEVLRRDADPDAAVSELGPNFFLMPAGRSIAHTYERFSTDDMNRVLEWAREHFDLVLLDSAPATVAADALALAGRCDASVLVCRAYSEKRGLVARMRNLLGDARADFLGVVVNAVKHTAGGYMRENIRATIAYNAEEQTDRDGRRKKSKDASADAEPVAAGPDSAENGRNR